MKIRILGTRGIPAQHGGFETFAESLAPYLVKKGWEVTVYCQQDEGDYIWEDDWDGVHRVHIPVKQNAALGTIVFDWKSTLHASQEKGLILTLGYNTAVFALIYRLKGITNLFNMDGLEWQRGKWSFLERSWFYLNERMGCWLGDHLIADHPEIKKHLETRVKPEKVTMIPYGADRIDQADVRFLKLYGISANGYSIVIGRPEPENSILEVVKAFSTKRRGHNLVVLGKYFPDENEYHKAVLNVASDEVIFAGAIYDKAIVNALRFYCRLYIHGHTVGGTNPSLVEALGAGSAVLAHDNAFNQWVAGNAAHYFLDEKKCAEELDYLLDNNSELGRMRLGSQERYLNMFTWDKILGEYEALLNGWEF